MTGFVIFVVVMIVVGLINKARQQSGGANGKPNARMQALVERIQAQQGGNQPIQFQGQYTQAAAGGPPPPQAPFPQAGAYQPPAQFQPAQFPVQYNPGPYQPPGHRPPQNNLPSAQQDLDARVREFMSTGNEVGAVRLLSEERGLGILEAQQYARSLVAPQSAPKSAPRGAAEPDEPDDDEGRYVGSAAFAESIFNLDDREENVWASGWVDTPEPDDRSDIDELWQTVSNPPRPAPPTAQ